MKLLPSVGLLVAVTAMALSLRVWTYAQTPPTPQAGVAQPGQTAATLPTDLSSLPRVHDPVMAHEGKLWVLFCTGRGITIQTSIDGKTWIRRGSVFPGALDWAKTTIPGSTDYYWAPDISYFNSQWHLYYSVSTFGSNHSVIGLATNVTLDPSDPRYKWQDKGAVIESQRADNWNAIDPNVAFDKDGQPWLSFGSFWSGLKMRKLDVSTGKPALDDPKLYDLATRNPDTQGAIEAPFIVRHGDRYYLFASFDFCCRGTDSTYNIRVGRAQTITGPYLDREGRDMRAGGGTLLRQTAGRWHGPGHNAVVSEGGLDWLIYHAYDAQNKGMSRLRIEELAWDAQGWPQLTTDGTSDTNAPLPVAPAPRRTLERTAPAKPLR